MTHFQMDWKEALNASAPFDSNVQTAELGWTGERISKIGLGTWQFGVSSLGSEQQALKLIRAALLLGVTTIDTAESYSSEHIVGKALQEMERKDVFLITKVSREHLSYELLLASCERSLRALGTSYIDLYLVHHDSMRVPLSETMKAMEYLQRNGKTRYIGVSNFSLNRLREARDCLSHTDVAVNEVHYNIVDRGAGKMLPYMQRERLGLLAYDPLGLGFLIGRVHTRKEYQWHPLGKTETLSKLEKVTTALNDISISSGRTPAQIALNWLATQEGVFPIFNTRSLDHLKDNLGCFGWELSNKQVERIDDAVRHSENPWSLGEHE